MTTGLSEPQTGGSCPARLAVAPDTGPLSPSERLFVPYRKRAHRAYEVNAEGAREFRIDYGEKEISFDEEHLFPFAEQLVRAPSFTGEEALRWGAGYRWEEVGPLLETLLDEGILRRGGTDPGDDTRDPRGGGLVPSQLTPSVCPAPRMWSLATCEALSRELTGHAFEAGYLEALIPVYRIAHPALDADGRQVGEGNVFPPQLRLDIETEWRVCQYSGSRYRDERPMNVSALRAMIKHWKPMMATLLRIRAAVRERFGPTAPSGSWTIGELHLLAALVLAVPAYQLLRGGGSAPQRPLHPVLSSLFRITDGIRMITHNLMFSVAAPRSGDQPISAAQLYDVAETSATLIGETGVCAGPRPMIDEFLAAAVDGVAPDGLASVELPDEVRALFAELPDALDYGLYAMQAWPTSACYALDVACAYQRILPIVEAVCGAAPAGTPPARLLARLRDDWAIHAQLELATPHDRDVHFQAYRDAYERAWRGVARRVGPPALADAVAATAEQPAHREAAARLRTLLAARAAPGGELDGAEPAALDGLVDAIVRAIRGHQAQLAATAAYADAINAVLDRPRPRRPLSARDLVSFYALYPTRRFADLYDALDGELGLRVEVTASAIEIHDRRARA